MYPKAGNLIKSFTLFAARPSNTGEITISIVFQGGEGPLRVIFGSRRLRRRGLLHFHEWTSHSYRPLPKSAIAVSSLRNRITHRAGVLTIARWPFHLER